MFAPGYVSLIGGAGLSGRLLFARPVERAPGLLYLPVIVGFAWTRTGLPKGWPQLPRPATAPQISET